jgi:hypothetical protein
MPRRIDSDARESTRHQYWHPQDLRQVVESTEEHDAKRILSPVLRAILLVLGIGAIGYAVLRSF